MCHVLIAPSNKQLGDNVFGQKIKYLLRRSDSFLLLYLAIIDIFLFTTMENEQYADLTQSYP